VSPSAGAGEDSTYPAIRIYEIDWDTNVVLNHYTYYLNLTKANLNKTAPP